MLSMGLPQTTIRYTPEEYLRRERDATERHQFYHGEIFAMAGGSAQHSLIIANVSREVGNHLKSKPCRLYESNLRIRVPRTTLYTYPDASIICGPLQFDPLDLKNETVLNPRLLIEVLSPSTEAYDRGGKFENYQQIESLQEYVLVSSELARVETFFRQNDGTWLYTSTTVPNAAVRLRSLDIELPLSEIYSGITFEGPKTEPSPS